MARTIAAFLMAGSLVGLTLLISAPAQSPPAENAAAEPNQDPRVDALIMQSEELKREVADQARRIANLEAAVKALQTPPPPVPIPAPTPLWHSAANWNLIKPGMSEAEVVELLGPPSSVQSVEDTRKLFYAPDPHSTSTLSGDGDTYGRPCHRYDTTGFLGHDGAKMLGPVDYHGVRSRAKGVHHDGDYT